MIRDFLARFISVEQSAPSNDKCAQLAASALLFEVIKADHSIAPEEMQTLKTSISSALDISGSELDSHINAAQKIADQATSLWEHTELVNKACSAEEKFELIVLMWKIALADGKIDSYEEHLIRRVSDLIHVPHMSFIEAKHIAGNRK